MRFCTLAFAMLVFGCRASPDPVAQAPVGAAPVNVQGKRGQDILQLRLSDPRLYGPTRFGVWVARLSAEPW
jgi:hypothetical protein